VGLALGRARSAAPFVIVAIAWVSGCDVAAQVFGPPSALNSNAASDAGEEFFPQVTTDGAGNWVAVWSSDDPMGSGIGTDDDIVSRRIR
jgi:hypothetical protein